MIAHRSGLRYFDGLLFGAAYTVLIFTVIYQVTGLHEEFRRGFAAEDGPLEWVTVAGLLATAIALIRSAMFLRRRNRRGAALACGVYALLFVFAAGEEISWGQRLFGWEPGDFFLEKNAQQETNLHNLVLGDVALVKTVFGPVLTLAILFYLLVLPMIYERSSRVQRLATRLAIPLADRRHMILALVATLVIAVVQLPLKWESYECVFSLLMLSIVLHPHNDEQVT
ncbi:hypothetical protein RA2_01471 [Roseovarius sp. A-2]|uniref:hypothetical protein n=1 Tax=Roseovarius sp. A-2 TaxID=1570360 RepID=UPI0009B538EA|nr:hypothetical protein [Roseovarius sp. A-2]GAW34423.1 hypothetical protein RA2_01471 [Roseovarius sp. A-2]